MHTNTKEKDQDHAMTQAEVAKEFGVTRGAIQVVERKAMEKLRRLLAERKINKEDYLSNL